LRLQKRHRNVEQREPRTRRVKLIEMHPNRTAPRLPIGSLRIRLNLRCSHINIIRRGLRQHIEPHQRGTRGSSSRKLVASPARRNRSSPNNRRPDRGTSLIQPRNLWHMRAGALHVNTNRQFLARPNRNPLRVIERENRRRRRLTVPADTAATQTSIFRPIIGVLDPSSVEHPNTGERAGQEEKLRSPKGQAVLTERINEPERPRNDASMHRPERPDLLLGGVRPLELK